MKYSPAITAAAILALCLLTAGCEDQVKLRQDLKTALEENEKLKADNQNLLSEVAEQAKTIETLRGLGGPERLKNFYVVKAIKLGNYTGGYNLDNQNGDEGIKVYIEPIDQYGNVIKAPAEVKIQLFDLAEPVEKNLIGEYAWNVEQVGKEWSGGFGAYHYSFFCQWKDDDPPKHNQITVRVEFTDYLTGEVFLAQKLCEIDIPPEKPNETKTEKQD